MKSRVIVRLCSTISSGFGRKGEPMSQPTCRRDFSSARCRWTALLICAVPVSSAFANIPGGGSDTGPDVVLIENESTVVLDNGLVRATMMKSNAKVTSLLYNGRQMLATDRQIYFSMDGGSSYE